jgi:hypothetical protein
MSKLSELFIDARGYMNDKATKPQYSNRILLRVLNKFGSNIKALNKDTSLNEGFFTISGVIQYAFPDDMWYPVNAKWNEGDSDYPLTILDPVNFSELDYRSGEVTGAPRYMSIKDKQIVLYPTPDKVYQIKLETVCKWNDILEANLDADFSDYFDKTYEYPALMFLVFKSLKANNDLGARMKNDFYKTIGGEWEEIRRMESFKYKPFNAKTRRLSGVKKTINNDNYNSGII